MQAADRLIGLGKQALHLATELVGQVIVLLFQDRPAHLGQIILRVEIIAVDRKARPECVFIQLQRFFRGIGGNGTWRTIGLGILGINWVDCASAKDHRSQTPVADGQSVNPLGCWFGVPQLEIARVVLRRLGQSQASCQRSSRGSGSGSEQKAAARESTHEACTFLKREQPTRNPYNSELYRMPKLLFFTKKIAYPDDGLYLFLGESRQQIPPH